LGELLYITRGKISLVYSDETDFGVQPTSHIAPNVYRLPSDLVTIPTVHYSGFILQNLLDFI